MMPPDAIPLPDFFDECPRCDGSKVEPEGSLRKGTPCGQCYGTGNVLTEAGRAVASVQEWREIAASRRKTNHPMHPETWDREYAEKMKAEGGHPWFPTFMDPNS